MLLTKDRSGQCVFCSYKALQRLHPPPKRLNGFRQKSTSAPSTSRTATANVDGDVDINVAVEDQSSQQIPYSKPRPPGQTPCGSTSPFPFRSSQPLFRQTKEIKLPPLVQHSGRASQAPKPARNGPTKNSAIRAFGDLLRERFAEVASSLRREAREERRWEPARIWGIKSEREFAEQVSKFREILEGSVQLVLKDNLTDDKHNPLFHSLRTAFVKNNVTGLGQELKYAFLRSVMEGNLNMRDFSNQQRLADLRYPTEWFPATRALQRTVHLHIGPTNSGKTYHALKRLESAETGVYAGPLRLLAHEVYTRFNAKGKPCALITGEEQRFPEGLKHLMHSCTVEMVPLNAPVDVAVIDEIQMIADSERGWAWTEAFLGVQAKEVHVCGEVRTRDLIENLCKMMGEKLVVHEYQRLNPLAMEAKSLQGDLSRLEKGDAIILFSRVAIHAMKTLVEKKTGKRCAVVYGSLPPETRAQQAALFNEPDNDYDYLVASDAVGMGLNLSIKRVIFESVTKFNGYSTVLMEDSSIKQIAGRAGRFKSAHQAVEEGQSTQPGGKPLGNRTGGTVTTLDRLDLPAVKKAMATEVEQIEAAGISPPSSVFLKFANYFPPSTPFQYILLRLKDMSTITSKFRLCSDRDAIAIAEAIQPYNLTNTERIIFMGAPISLRSPRMGLILDDFVSCVADKKSGELLEMKNVDLELLDKQYPPQPARQKAYLHDLEGLHQALTLYLWLSYRFAGTFRSQTLAFYVKGLVEEKINDCLTGMSYDESSRKATLKIRMNTILRHEKARQLEGELGGTSDGGSQPQPIPNYEDIATGDGYAPQEHLSYSESR